MCRHFVRNVARVIVATAYRLKELQVGRESQKIIGDSRRT